MFADGFISDYTNRYGEDKFGMTLHADDIASLEAFKKSIKATNPITDVSSHKSSLRRILMSSQKTVDDLVSHGCVKQKSLIIQPPTGVPKELIHHFIRGFFDGDGSIYWNKSAFQAHKNWRTPSYSICITSTKEMIEWLINTVGEGIFRKKFVVKKPGIYDFLGTKKSNNFVIICIKMPLFICKENINFIKNYVKYQETEGINV
mgnify:CR=1 FL=1